MVAAAVLRVFCASVGCRSTWPIETLFGASYATNCLPDGCRSRPDDPPPDDKLKVRHFDQKTPRHILCGGVFIL